MPGSVSGGRVPGIQHELFSTSITISVRGFRRGDPDVLRRMTTERVTERRLGPIRWDWVAHRRSARRWLVLGVGLLTLRYFFWRITETLPAPGLELSVAAAYVLLALEMLCAYDQARTRQLLVDRSNRSAEADAHSRWFGSPDDAPLIDILIPTYDEKRSILRTTLLAASRQTYRRFRVWVLDDGRRPWLAELCSELGVQYLAREVNRDFKAGNLNAALDHVLALSERPSYIAVFDADFVAHPAFLGRTLALMHDPRVGIVQTPQFFYNSDPFQYAFRARWAWPEDWRSNSVFLSSLDARGFASCFGTSFLARVDALREVAGFPTQSLLEDALLSMRLGHRGWRTVYLDERLSVGLSAEGLAELRAQRTRWYLGEVQLFLEDWRSLRRWVALRPRFVLLRQLAIGFADSLLRLAWPLVPAVYWFTGVSLLQASARDTLSYCLPLLAHPVLMYCFSRGAIMPLATQAEKLVLAPIRLQATVRGLLASQHLRFDVTAKGVRRTGRVVHWRTLLPLAALASALLSGMVYRSLVGWADPSAADYLFWNAAVSLGQLVLLLVALVPCVERPRHREAERYRDGRRVRFGSGQERGACEVRDLSIRGARLSALNTHVGASLRLSLTNDLELEARVIRSISDREFGVEFCPTLDQEGRLIELILCTDRYLNQPDRWNWWTFCAALLRAARPGSATP